MFSELIPQMFCAVFGFSSGVVISGAVFAFITAIGVVPRIAEKTVTVESVRIYEESIMFGGMVGTLIMFFEFHLPIGKVVTAFFSFCGGIFFGALAMSLAEVLDVIPILTRRGKVEHGIYYFILAIAIGKLMGSLMYYLIPGFFTNES